jgi:hypothetical protein
MFQSLLDYTKELESTATSTQEFLRTLRGGRQRLVNKISKAEKEFSTVKNPDKYVKSILPAIEKDVREVAADILESSILEAIRDNVEFDWPLYRKSLFLAAKDKDTYKVYNLGGTGFNTRLTFTMDFNKTAGRLEDWARGVKLTRKDLQVKVPKKGSKKRETSALLASRAWGGIFGSRNADPQGRFAKTIKSRLSYSGRVAPFWQLLDKGTVPMGSDRGGYPTPRGKPTNFIQRAQESMEGYTKNVLNGYKANYEKLVSNYEAAIAELQEALVRINVLVEQIELNVKVINKIKQSYEGNAKYIDSNKVEKALQLIQQGLEGRVELTATGSKRRTRPTLSQIARIAGLY